MDGDLLHILQHSLGVDQYGQGNQYRNHFVAGGKDVEKCRTLVEMGYMKEVTPSVLTGNMPGFWVTSSGIDAVALFSPKPPKISRSKKRYRVYLQCESGETYGEWLKNSYWDDCRKQNGV